MKIKQREHVKGLFTTGCYQTWPTNFFWEILRGAQRLWLNRTNGKDSRVRLRTSLKPKHNRNVDPNPKLITPKRKLRKETKKKRWGGGRELSGFALQNSQTPPFCVRQTNQLCQMAIRCKLHNFLAFYSTTRDWQEVSSQSYAAVLPVGTI